MTKWLVAGLGNPGAEYERTRHNVGFMVIDRLAREFNVSVSRAECRALMGQTYWGSETVELAKPQTFMNLSGEAVSCLLAKQDRSIERLIVVSDDAALPLGRIRIRKKGSHGGQNGLRSIIDRLGTQDFIRVRIGILPDHEVGSLKNFVLSDFPRSERDVMESVIQRSAKAVETIVRDKVDRAMAEFNSETSTDE